MVYIKVRVCFDGSALIIYTYIYLVNSALLIIYTMYLHQPKSRYNLLHPVSQLSQFYTCVWACCANFVAADHLINI